MRGASKRPINGRISCLINGSKNVLLSIIIATLWITFTLLPPVDYCVIYFTSILIRLLLDCILWFLLLHWWCVTCQALAHGPLVSGYN